MSAMGMLFTVFGEARLVPGRIRVHAATRGRDPVRRSPTLRTVAPQSAVMTRSAHSFHRSAAVMKRGEHHTARTAPVDGWSVGAAS